MTPEHPVCIRGADGKGPSPSPEEGDQDSPPLRQLQAPAASGWKMFVPEILIRLVFSSVFSSWLIKQLSNCISIPAISALRRQPEPAAARFRLSVCSRKHDISAVARGCFLA